MAATNRRVECNVVAARAFSLIARRPLGDFTALFGCGWPVRLFDFGHPQFIDQHRLPWNLSEDSFVSVGQMGADSYLAIAPGFHSSECVLNSCDQLSPTKLSGARNACLDALAAAQKTLRIKFNGVASLSSWANPFRLCNNLNSRNHALTILARTKSPCYCNRNGAG